MVVGQSAETLKVTSFGVGWFGFLGGGGGLGVVWGFFPCLFVFGLPTTLREWLSCDPSHFETIFPYKEIFQVPNVGTGSERKTD